MPLRDPTYVKEQIDANPDWKLAFYLSELDNKNAPIGWSRYIDMATILRVHKKAILQQIVTEKDITNV